MNKYIKCINYIVSKSAPNVDPENKLSFKHLMNVYNLLRSWNCSEDICYAGMFYSVYKTESNKQIIKELIGQKSEEIVCLYNKDDFNSFETKIIHFAKRLDQGFIETIDNIYDSQEAFEIYKYFRKGVGWHSNASAFKLSRWTKFRYDLKFKNKKEIFLRNLSNDILKEYKIFELLKLHSAYASANPYGTVHESHTDEDQKGCVTVMFYLNEFWHIDYAGETVFYDKLNSDIIKSVIPKPARAVIFDNTIMHCARDCRRDVADIRMVLTFKYVIKSNEK